MGPGFAAVATLEGTGFSQAGNRFSRVDLHGAGLVSNGFPAARAWDDFQRPFFSQFAEADVLGTISLIGRRGTNMGKVS